MFTNFKIEDVSEFFSLQFSNKEREKMKKLMPNNRTYYWISGTEGRTEIDTNTCDNYGLETRLY